MYNTIATPIILYTSEINGNERIKYNRRDDDVQQIKWKNKGNAKWKPITNKITKRQLNRTLDADGTEQNNKKKIGAIKKWIQQIVQTEEFMEDDNGGKRNIEAMDTQKELTEIRRQRDRQQFQITIE